MCKQATRSAVCAAGHGVRALLVGDGEVRICGVCWHTPRLPNHCDSCTHILGVAPILLKPDTSKKWWLVRQRASCLSGRALPDLEGARLLGDASCDAVVSLCSVIC